MTDNDKASLEITFTGVCVHNRDDVFLSSVIDKYADESPDHAFVFRRFKSQYTQLLINHAVGSLCVFPDPNPRVFCMGVSGTITVALLPGIDTEVVDSTDEGPNSALLLRCIRPVGGRLYVAGMARQFYRRESPNLWVRQDESTFVPRAERTQAFGFHAIDGVCEDAIYAVGQLGEIWFFNGRSWIQQDSPTNVALTCVRSVTNSEVYVAGLAGVVLSGRNGIWRVIKHEATTEDFWGIAWFRGKVYLSNYDGIYVLNGETLELIDLGIDEKLTTAYLDANDEVLWSVGHKHLAMTLDGEIWTRILGPTQ